MAKTVTHDENLTPYFGNEELLQVAQTRKFSDIVFELLSERTPTEAESKIFAFILNISIDHGPETPSALETIKAAKEGKNLSEAVVAGIMQINSSHGGATEPAMELLYKIKSAKLKVQNLVKEYIEQDKRLPGFGHRIYKIDPRTQVIFQMLQQANLGEEFISIAKELETELSSQKGRKLPCNIDGAIAVALCCFGWEPSLGKAVFIIARTSGLCGQYLNHNKVIQ